MGKSTRAPAMGGAQGPSVGGAPAVAPVGTDAPSQDNSVVQDAVSAAQGELPWQERDALEVLEKAMAGFPDLAMGVGGVLGQATLASTAIDNLATDDFAGAVGRVMEAGETLAEQDRITGGLGSIRLAYGPALTEETRASLSLWHDVRSGMVSRDLPDQVRSLLTPRTHTGQPIGEVTVPPATYDLVETADLVGGYTSSVLTAADLAYQLGVQGHALAGRDALALAVRLSTDVLSDWAPESGEADFVFRSLLEASPSADFLRAVEGVTGRPLGLDGTLGAPTAEADVPGASADLALMATQPSTSTEQAADPAVDQDAWLDQGGQYDETGAWVPLETAFEGPVFGPALAGPVAAAAPLGPPFAAPPPFSVFEQPGPLVSPMSLDPLEDAHQEDAPAIAFEGERARPMLVPAPHGQHDVETGGPNVAWNAEPDRMTGHVGVDRTAHGDRGQTTRVGARVDGELTSETTKVGAKATFDHASADGSRAKVDGGVFFESSGGSDYVGGEGTVAWGDGQGKATEVRTEAKVGPDGAFFGGSVGKTETRTGPAPADDVGEVPGELPQAEETTTSRRAGGHAEIIAKDDETGFAGSGFYEHGKVKVSVKGGRTEKFYPVEQVGPRSFRVRYGVIWSGGGSIRGAGARGGVQGGIDHSDEQQGSRVFPTMEAANAFREAQVVPEGTTGVPDSAAAALALAPGEVRGSANTTTGSAQGEVRNGIAGAGVSGSISDTDGVEVTRGGGNDVTVTISDRDQATKAAFLHVGMASAGKGTVSGDVESATVTFDLGSDAGRSAYEYYVRTKKLPPRSDGIKVKVETKAEMSGDTFSMNLPGVAFSESQTVTDGTTTRTQDGRSKQTHFSAGNNANMLKIWGIGHYGESHGLEVMDSGEEKLYSVRSTIDGDERDDQKKGMSRATGFHMGGEVDGDARGKWTVSSVFQEEDMKRVAAYAANPELSRASLGERFHADHHADSSNPFNDDLEDALAMVARGKDDDDALRGGLARWVAEGGQYALADLRKYAGYRDPSRGMGEDTQDFHLELENDPNWTGLRGHKMAELEISMYERRISNLQEDPRGVYLEIRESIRLQEDRRRALPKYREVPFGLVQQELDRTDALITRLEKLRSEVLRATPPEDPSESMSRGSLVLQDPGLATMNKAETTMRNHRREAGPKRNRAFAEHGRHHEGGTFDSGHAEHVPVRQLRGEKDAYAAADETFGAAKSSWASAEALERQLDDAVRAGDDPLTVAALAARAGNEYKRAGDRFDEAVSAFGAIKDRNRGGVLDRRSPEPNGALFQANWVRDGAWNMSLRAHGDR